MEEELVLILQKLVGVVEDASPKLWEIAMAQVRMEGMRSIFLAVLFTGLLLVSFWLLKFSIKAFRESDGYEDGWIVGIVFGALGLMFFVGLMISSLYNAIGYICNPAYYAIEVIMGLVR